MVISEPDGDLRDRTILITGASSGIGRATAEAVAARGARVILAVRDVAKGNRVAATLPGTSGTHQVRVVDLADMSSIHTFAESIPGHIDVLVNNAGVSSQQLRRTKDGFELQFGTNHLGHFLLTALLLDQITSRVVTLSSQAERMARLDLNDLNWHSRTYAGGRAYADSKMADLMFTLELDRRLRESGSTVRALAAHPGLVITAMYDRPTGQKPGLWDRLLPRLGQSADQGALPVLLAIAGDLPGGSFTGPQRMFHMRGGAEVIGQSARAKDTRAAARLWSASEQLTNIRFAP